MCSGDTHDFSSPHPQILNQVKERQRRACVCECVRARAGKRVVYVCVGREMEDRGFPCVCVRAHVCVGEADSAVCVCVCWGGT